MVLKKLAVTGPSGMLGRHFLSLAKEKDILCVTASRHHPRYLPDNFKWHPWNLEHGKSLNEMNDLFGKVDAMVHIGAYVPKKEEPIEEQKMFDINVRSSFYLGQWAAYRNIPMVFISGANIYAHPEESNIHENNKKKYNGFSGFYGHTKLFAEDALRSLEEYGLKLCILRPSSVYGYGLSKNKMLYNFLQQASEKKIIHLAEPVNDRINLIHANDVAQAILQALEKEAFGTFNVAHHKSHTIFEIAKACSKAVGKSTVEIKDHQSIRKPISRFDLNCNSAKKKFGFTAKIDLIEGTRRMWQKEL